MTNQKLGKIIEFVRDLVIEPERLDDKDKIVFEAKELLQGLKCTRCGHKVYNV